MVLRNPSFRSSASNPSISTLMASILSALNGTRNSPVSGSLAAFTTFSTSCALSLRLSSVMLTTARMVFTRLSAKAPSFSFSSGSDVASALSAMRRKNCGDDTTRIARDTAFGSSYGLALLIFVIMSSMTAISAGVGSRCIPSKRDRRRGWESSSDSPVPPRLESSREEEEEEEGVDGTAEEMEDAACDDGRNGEGEKPRHVEREKKRKQRKQSILTTILTCRRVRRFQQMRGLLCSRSSLTHSKQVNSKHNTKKKQYTTLRRIIKSTRSGSLLPKSKTTNNPPSQCVTRGKTKVA